MTSRKAFATTTLALAALLLTTGFSAAATTPKFGPTGPGATDPTLRAEIASPGDAFMPAVDNGPKPRADASAYTLSCKVVVGPDGKATFIIENIGTSTIPKYFIVVIQTPYGTMELLASPVIDPGETLTLPTSNTEYGPPGSEYDCSAKVKSGQKPDPEPEDVPK